MDNVTPQTVNSHEEAVALAKQGTTAQFWIDDTFMVVTPESVKNTEVEVVLPPKFDETTPETLAGGWVRDPEIDAMDLSKAKQFIRDLGLHAPSDIAYVAQAQADEVNRTMTEILKNQTKNDKLLESQKIELELKNLRAREEAKKRYKNEQTTADLSLFNSINLGEALLLPEEPMQWRINKLLMVGHITTVTAPAKAGKTVLQVNRVKSYVDGNPLFGHFQTGKALEGNVGVWNYELMPNQMHEWFRKKGIVNRHKIHVINARGADLYIQNDEVLEAAIKWIKDYDIEILEIDPLQAAFLGSVSNDEDAASYISALQRLQKESGVKDIILTTHMGHGGKVDANLERSIGSARWEGFADNMWIYKRDHKTNTSYLRIDKGRVDEVEEFGLSVDKDTWTLNYLGDNSGIEAKKKNEVYRNVVTRLYDGTPKLKTVDIVEPVCGTNADKKKQVRTIIEDLIESGIVKEESVKQESGQKALMLTMNQFGCGLFANMIATKGEIVPLTSADLSQGG